MLLSVLFGSCSLEGYSIPKSAQLNARCITSLCLVKLALSGVVLLQNARGREQRKKKVIWKGKNKDKKKDTKWSLSFKAHAARS